MFTGSFRSKMHVYLSNLLGWRTKRKIVVIESDDWGSVRIKDKEAFLAMKAYGLNVESIHYNSVDALESNLDLELLFETLSNFKDSKERYAIFTPMCIMGNPNFKKIEDSEYANYFFQPLNETLKEYPEHDRVLSLWREGFKTKVFVPEIHGREHVNVRRYMQILQSHKGKEGLRFSLLHRSVGPKEYKSICYPNYLGALYPIEKKEITELHEHIYHAGKLFKEYMGYEPRVFIAPNAEEPKELENTLKRIGVKYLTRSKRRIYPLGDGQFAKEWNFVGKVNENGQVILNRNCFFEPVTWGEHGHNTDWVNNCLKEIDIAFRMEKPAVISSHRVNYIGFIRPENREKGLFALKQLIKTIIKKWPNVEFMSSNELGNEIEKTLNKN